MGELAASRFDRGTMRGVAFMKEARPDCLNRSDTYVLIVLRKLLERNLGGHSSAQRRQGADPAGRLAQSHAIAGDTVAGMRDEIAADAASGKHQSGHIPGDERPQWLRVRTSTP